MNSCLYECKVMHHRLKPISNRFVYTIFMFYLDLDEVDNAAASSRLMSRNRFNVFNFRDDDHAKLSGSNVKENIVTFLRSKGIRDKIGKIFLLTHLRTFGHVFNPVSFYFCFDEMGEPLCAVPEVGNTFNEQKLFKLGRETFERGSFRSKAEKYFYVSPFIDLDTTFDFDLRIPGQSLHIRIDDYKDGERFFLSSLTGERKPLTDLNLLKYILRIPFVTLKVLGLIHLQAALLYAKKLPYHKKSEYPELQKEVIVWNK